MTSSYDTEMTMPRTWRWPSVVTCVAIAAVTIFSWVGFDAEQDQTIDRATRQATAAIRAEIASRMESRHDALIRMVRRWVARGVPSRPEWEDDARQYILDFPGLSAVQWVDPSYKVRWSIPEELIDSGGDVSLASYPLYAQTLRNSRQSNEVVSSHSGQLASGGIGFVSAVPIVTEERFWGFIVGTYQVDPLFNSLLPTDRIASGYALSILNGDDEMYRRGGTSTVSTEYLASEGTVELSGTTWTIRVWPAPTTVSEMASPLPTVVLVSGLLLALLLSFIVRLAQSARSHSLGLQRAYEEVQRANRFLDERVEERTQELRGSRRAALNIAQDAEAARKSAELAADALRESEEALRTINDELEDRVIERTAEMQSANESLRTEIEQRQQAQQNLIQRTQQLESSIRELDAFSYTVSHDLRAPLRAIVGFSRILLDEYAEQLQDEAKHYLNVVMTNAKNMGQLIDDLLAFARLGRQPINRTKIDPAHLVSECLKELTPQLEDHSVKTVIGNMSDCTGDPVLLKQVFHNLLSNAVKYTRKSDSPAIEVGCQNNGETVYFVKDNGVGFDMRYADKLFGVFQRLHRAEDYEGTGVGLAIVQRIIHRHGGRVWAEAEPDKGAVFSFTVGEKQPDERSR